MLINNTINPNPFSFLVDTQADISIIKLDSIGTLQIDPTEEICIKGITNNTIKSIGTVDINLFVGNHVITNKFHVVPNNFSIPSDGILGKDFIKGLKCNISYEDMTISFYLGNNLAIIDILSSPITNTVVIPPRSQSIRKFHLKRGTGAQVIESQEISAGVFLARTIVDRNHAYVKVLNVTDKPVVIPSDKIEHENLSDYYVFTTEETKVNAIRTKKLIELIKEKTPKHAEDSLMNLITEYNDIFALDSDRMSINNFYEQKLRLKDDTPVFSKNYRLPETQRQEINAQVEKLLKNDLIENSVSHYNSPVILVPKKCSTKEKKWRMCIDYRLLNKKLIPDKYPLPRIDDILDELGKAKYFSILDLYSGFHQIPLEKSSRELTSFSTQKGSFQWKVLPFGLNVAPNSFARMMNLAFSGLEPQQAFLYMDDIIVIGCSVKHHRNNLESIFKICRKYNLKLNPYKCEFYRNEVVFLGHKCTDKGILPNEEKIEAVQKYPTPLNKDEVRSFVALANFYRRFINNFAEIARPLNKLTRKKSIFIWSKECQKAFEMLKNSLIQKPILQYPDFKKEFVVTVDASNYACGAVLSQNHNGHKLPISYISRTFQKGELNKAIIEKELLAIHFAITYFRPYLYGRHFTVQSDHRPLIFLFNMKNPASKLTRIRLDLEEYSFDV